MPDKIVKIKQKNGSIKKLSTSSDEYKKLYSNGKIANYDEKNDVYVAPDIEEVVVKGKLSDVGKYKQQYEKEFPKEKYVQSYLDNYKWAGQSQQNYPKNLDDEYEIQKDKYVGQQIQKAKPQGNKSREEWLNSLKPEEERLVKLDAKNQTSMLQEAVEGVRGLVYVDPFKRISTSSNYSKREKEEKSKEYEKSPFSSAAGNTTGIFAPLGIGSKLVQAPFMSNYSMKDAIKGKRNNVSASTDIMTDPLNFVGGEILTGAGRAVASKVIKNGVEAVGTGLANLEDINYVNKAVNQPNISRLNALSISKTNNSIKKTMDAENTFVRGVSTNFDATAMLPVKRILKEKGIDYINNPADAAKEMLTTIPKNTGYGRVGLLEKEKGLYTSNSLDTAKGYTYGDGYIGYLKRPTNYSMPDRKKWVDNNLFDNYPAYTDTTFKGHNPIMQDAYNPNAIDLSKLNKAEKIKARLLSLQNSYKELKAINKFEKDYNTFKNDPRNKLSDLQEEYAKTSKMIYEREKEFFNEGKINLLKRGDTHEELIAISKRIDDHKKELENFYPKSMIESFNAPIIEKRRIRKNMEEDFKTTINKNFKGKATNYYSHYVIKGEEGDKPLELIKLERYKSNEDFTRAHHGVNSPGLSTNSNTKQSNLQRQMQNHTPFDSKLIKNLKKVGYDKIQNNLKGYKYAYGGTINSTIMKYTQPKNTTVSYKNGTSSRDKNWVQTALAGAGLLSNLIGGASAQKKQKEALLQQERNALQTQFAQKQQQDAIAARDWNAEGDNNVEYYANGGEIESSQKSMQNFAPVQSSTMQPNSAVMSGKPVSNGGFQTMGGQLVPIGKGIEKAVGNKHEESTIDGVGGIQLHDEQGFQGEIEDGEVVVDGTNILSDRLMFDNKNTYAQKMEKLTRKRNKLEKQYDSTTDKRVKAGIDRKLMGLNMGEEALFKHQEAQKEILGTKALQNMNTFAFGGKIKKYAPGGVLPVPKFRKWKLDHNGKPVLDTLENDNPTTEELNKKDVDWNKSSLVSTVPDTTTTSNYKKLEGITYDANEVADDDDYINIGREGGIDLTRKKGLNINSKDVENIAQGALSIVDNVGNMMINRNTPKIPVPLLNTAVPLKTRVNINPQLAELRRTQKANTDNILNNTSSSNNAKANIVASRLATTLQMNTLLGEKENKETALENANAQNKQQVGIANTALTNEYNFRNFQRTNDMQSRASQNLANLQGDIKDYFLGKKLDKQFDKRMEVEAKSGQLGETAAILAQDKDYMATSENRKLIREEAIRTNNKWLLEYLNRNGY